MTADPANYTMTDTKVDRPTCTRIVVERIEDDSPDLSWLDQTDDDMGEGFEATARARKESFYEGEWSMMAVRATATVLIPMGGAAVMQTLKSPGLWGVESDSEEDYFKGLEEEQLDDLRQIMDALNIAHADAKVVRP